MRGRTVEVGSACRQAALTDCHRTRQGQMPPVRRDRLPDHTGQTSPAALSHTMKMRSSAGASGLANTSPVLAVQAIGF